MLTLFALLFITVLPTVSETDFSQLISSYRGKVVVVNFWATWCGPCREEFPHLVRLYEEEKNNGVVVVTISMDEPEDGEKVLSYLRSQQAKFPIYLRGFRNFQVFVNQVDPEWSGGIPATFIFSARGQRVFSHEGTLTYATLKERVIDAGGRILRRGSGVPRVSPR